MVPKVRGLCSGLIILLSIFLYSDSSLGTNFDDIRIDVPADGRVHVENRFGDVNAEVWDKPFVSVSAVVTGPTSSVLKRSPILIDNRGSYLSMSVLLKDGFHFAACPQVRCLNQAREISKPPSTSH